MAAKPKKSAAAAKSFSSATATTATTTTPATTTTTPTTAPVPAVSAAPRAGVDAHPAHATMPALSSSLPDSMHSLYKERPGPTSTKVVSDDPRHPPNQPYQGAAPLRQVQPSPNLNSGQPHQPSYAGQGVFSPQGGLHSPYLNNPQQFQQHPQASEGTYYTSNPSPRSTTSGAYYPADKPEAMATATATMHRPYPPPIYATPQSNSPASVTSPQDHARSMYQQQPPPMQQPMYHGYPNYQSMGPVHQPYGPHQPPQINAQPMLPYQPNAGPLPQSTLANQPPPILASPRMKMESNQHYGQTPQSQTSTLQKMHSASATPTNNPLTPGQPQPPLSTSNAAPGPIPATTPLVVRQDQNGVQWIAFEYSRDRVKMEYTIRCDVESVDATQLTQEFKSENCVYPRACVPKDQYKGNRLAYETDCNQVGWALAELNPCLRGKRGLIQRAVDSWRNSNQDPRLRSRRVRRQAKMHNRAKVGALGSSAAGTATSVPGLPSSSSGSMGVPSTRPPSKITTSTQPVHRHPSHDVSPAGQDSVGGQSYSSTPGIHRQGSTPQHLASPAELRQAHTFPGFHPYPSAPTTMGPSMAPSMQGGIHGYGRPGGSATMASTTTDDAPGDTELYGDLPEAKRRKFIVVEDTQKNAKVRVKVTLDQVDMSEIPDSYRKQNSVFPRAYFPVQMQSATESTSAARFMEDDVEEMDEGPPTVGRMTVPCHLSDGNGEVEVSKLSKGKLDQERKLNELGYRMAWGQSRVFATRPIFLGRALDAYRKKQRSLIMETTKPDQIPPHLETRPGKRRWQERTQQTSQSLSPLATNSA